MPKVSIIIPCYNVENYIDKCIASVFNQNFFDYEIILIDDGSTDNTFNKCVQWKNKDERIIFVAKKNQGLGESRNLGISMANSKYITFLDADDWWDKDYLSEMIRGTEGGKNDLVICDLMIVYKIKNDFENKISAVRLSNGKINPIKEKYLLSQARTQACGKLYKRSLFLENNVKEPANAYEDVATTPYIVAKAKNIYHVAKPLYFYLKNRGGSIINNFYALGDLLLSLSYLINYFKNDSIFESYYSELRRIFWGELCFLYRVLDTKFSDNNDDKKAELRKKCDDVVYENFPELKYISKQKFYVNNDLIREGLTYIIPKKSQIIGDFNNSDFAILFNGESLNENFNGKIISLNNVLANSDDKEKIVWDIADEIYDNLMK